VKRILLVMLVIFGTTLYIRSNSSECDYLLYALDKFPTEECIKCIEKSDSLECRNENGLTPLLVAVDRKPIWRKKEEQREIVLALLKKGANVNAKIDKNGALWHKGDTPLILSSMRGDLDVVKILIEYGADVNAKNDYGESPIMAACWMDEIDIVKYLLEKQADINLKTKGAENALLYCMKSDKEKLELVRLILDKGLDVNSKNDRGFTPLMYSCIFGNYQTVKLLLERGAKINEQESYKRRTALMLACRALRNQRETVQLLLENAADVNIADREGKTAYFHALEKYNWEIAELLVANGADTNPKNRVCKKILKKARKERCVK